MPQHKQPTSLYALCINEAQVLIETSSDNIARRFGDYRNPRTKQAIQQVQKHLLSIVGGFYLDKIFNFYRETFFKSLKHAPIYFSICLHVNMQQMTMWAWTQGWKKYESAAFWREHLPRLTQLKQLSLNSRDTSVLQAVGQHCLKLEILELAGSDISNEGYACLVNCKDLKEINAPLLEPACTISPEALGFLLRSLPKLESVFGSTLSDALDSMNDLTSLQLTSVTLEPAKPQHIRAIARLCSNIKALKLENDYDQEVDTEMAPTLTALAESNIKASILEINDFNFGPEMKGLFSQKGIFITKLCLGMSPGMKSFVSFSDIKFIGFTCPNIVSLYLNMHKISNDCSEIPTNRIFTLLESLEIWGHEWDYTLVQIILAHAYKIRTLTLRLFKSAVDYDFDNEDKYFLDIPLTKLLLINPLAELRSLKLLGVTQITMNSLDKLLDRCPQFCSFATEEDQIFDDYRFKLLRVQIKEQNLDFHFPPNYDKQPWVLSVYLEDSL